MITGSLDPRFDTARFELSLAFNADGVPIPWLPEHVISVAFRERSTDYARGTATSADGSGRVTFPADGLVRLAFPSLTFLEPGTWELLIMLSDAQGDVDGVLLNLPIRKGRG
jgi:hypothetical protein